MRFFQAVSFGYCRLLCPTAIAVANDPASLLRQEVSYMEGKSEENDEAEQNDDDVHPEETPEQTKHRSPNKETENGNSPQGVKRPSSQVSGAQAVLGAMGI